MSNEKEMAVKTKYGKRRARAKFILQQFQNSCKLSNMRGLAMIAKQTDEGLWTHYTFSDIPNVVGVMISRMIYDISLEYEGEDKINFLRSAAGKLPDGIEIF